MDRLTKLPNRSQTPPARLPIAPGLLFEEQSFELERSLMRGLILPPRIPTWARSAVATVAKAVTHLLLPYLALTR
jgi:hypothetical protein